VLQDGCLFLAMAPSGEEIAGLRERLRRNPHLADRVFIAPPETIRDFLTARRHAALTHYAVNRLSSVLPRLSVRRLGTGQGAGGPTLLAGAAVALSLLAPATALCAFGYGLTAFIANCAVWKLAAAFRRPPPLRLEPVPTELLPYYTVLVPLYREADVIADLVRRLTALDYPASKLQVLILLEADDVDSCVAAALHASGPIFELIVVPPGGPRTKPKALTYALPFARGELVVVYDAEDRPEPGQLRKAAAAFRERPQLGCVQASLVPDNEESLLSRMFKLEYAANFEILLPALASWRAPLPLGGTSNHFPREILDRVGAWDPFNVTEDADLGVRLARFGLQTATILSRTYEEAPVTFRQWLPQRRRWIKGWMQTTLLCMGGGMPPSLRLPLRSELAVHGILTAGVLGLLFYPLSLIAVLAAAATLAGGRVPAGIAGYLLLAANGTNFAAILAASAVSAFRGLGAVGARRLAWHIVLFPLYWALMCFAAWQALLQLLKQPSLWEKTPHGVARDRRTPDAPAWRS
jgi:cellulose synthase/poly-beta-1,6-N-acetylglucosamine synthase-like glycosyltransferase